MAKLNSHNILILRKLVENGYHTKRDNPLVPSRSLVPSQRNTYHLVDMFDS